MVLNAFLRLLRYKDRFAQKLGYGTFEQMEKETVLIFAIPPESNCFATKLPDGRWAIWHDQDPPPFKTIEFRTWAETYDYLKKLFNAKGLTQECWRPEGYDTGADNADTPPDPDKKRR